MTETPHPTEPAVLWFTGLSGAGKSTIAVQVAEHLAAAGLDVEHLDGDHMRSVFPTGFSRKDREDHVRRVGYMASLLEKHGVLVIASFISPYRASRKFVRHLCSRFVEVYVSTPLDACETRDVKGLYRRARAGEIENFTGISDPYEPPERPELTIDTTRLSLDEACRTVLNYVMEFQKP